MIEAFGRHRGAGSRRARVHIAAANAQPLAGAGALATESSPAQQSMREPRAASWVARSLEAAQPNTPSDVGSASSAASAAAAAIMAVRPAKFSKRRVRACGSEGQGRL